MNFGELNYINRLVISQNGSVNIYNVNFMAGLEPEIAKTFYELNLKDQAKIITMIYKLHKKQKRARRR